MTTPIHRMKVTLRSIRPPIWRRIEVRSDIRLDQLAYLLVVAIGWEGYHLDQFRIGETRYLTADLDPPLFGPRPLNAARYRLEELLAQTGDKMIWDYDFGDGWEHDVVVEAIEAADGRATYPRCIKGRRACPPEDCGGVWGYENLVEALAAPAHPEHAELTEWLGHPYDPAHFDPAETTEAMRAIVLP